jgi:hypothetical protein
VHYCVGNDEPPNPTRLVSGSYPYLKQAASQPQVGKVLYLLDEPWKGKTPKSSNGITWQRLKPTQFGGSVSYPVLVGTSGFVFSPLRSLLDRNIGHILDHGIRADFLSSSSVALLGTPGSEFYLSDSLLDPHHLGRPVAYSTAYSVSDWGSRALSNDELGVAFGLPTRLRLGGLHLSVFPFVPLQVLDDCLDSLCRARTRVLQPLATPAPRVWPLPLPESWRLYCPSPGLHPSIQKRLAHSWIDHPTI